MTEENQRLWNEHLAIDRELEKTVSATGKFPEDVAELLNRQRLIWHSIIFNPTGPKTLNMADVLPKQPRSTK